MWPCIVLPHAMFFQIFPVCQYHLCFPNLLLFTGTHSYSYCAVHTSWVPPCYCTHLNPVACDTSSRNAKQSQILLSAATGGKMDILHICPSQSKHCIILVFLHNHMHCLHSFSLCSHSLREDLIPLALLFVDSYCIP